jgi:DNA polymerase-3 subunit epsilon
MGSYDWVAPAYFGPEGALDFVAFDLETTGLDSKKERIVEIGAVRFDRRGPIGRFSVLVDPGIPMPPEASRINGITDEMLKGKPTLDEVLGDFLRFARDSVLVAHNASFDCGFVDAALAERYERARKAKGADAAQGSLLDAAEEGGGAKTPGWTPPYASLPHRIVDTKNYAKEAFPGRWKYALQELARFVGIQAKDAHRAEDDARVCMELFIKCAEKSAGKEVATFP